MSIESNGTQYGTLYLSMSAEHRGTECQINELSIVLLLSARILWVLSSYPRDVGATTVSVSEHVYSGV